MRKKLLRSWKKVFESDLSYIAFELKDIVLTPAVIILEGAMGAGKTTFSKVFMGDDNESYSPTYSVLYESKDILHGDFYRIESREDVIQLELSLYLEEKNFFLLEWGLKHLKDVDPELPEEFSVYLLELSMANHDSDLSRSFDLFKLDDY